MTESIITSRDNSLVRHARRVRDGKESAQIFIEGVRLCEEAVKASLAIETLFYTERLSRDERGRRLLEDARSLSRKVVALSEDVLSSISDTKTPQGIIALAARPQTDSSVHERATQSEPLIIILHGLNNPANAGAILRTAEAAGATGAITTKGTADIFSPKSLRGAMGSSFRLPVWTGALLAEVLDWCRARKIMSVSTDVRAAHSYTEIDWRVPSALIMGAEAAGLSREESAATDLSVKIPMRPPVESLNVAVASAILLYEAARQRTVGGRQ